METGRKEKEENDWEKMRKEKEDIILEKKNAETVEEANFEINISGVEF